VWVTGLPGSGKSIIARAVAETLRADGEDVRVLELDEIRRVITPAPTYSDAEREAVYRALVYIGARLVEAGIPVIFDATAHRRAWRDLARATLPRFAEVQLHCPGATVPGVNVEYEYAHAPELTLDTTTHSVEEAAAAVVDEIRARFHAVPPSRDRTHDHEAIRGLLLEKGSAEQRQISRRARTHAARLLVDAGKSRPESDAREKMVDAQIAGRGIHDAGVLAAMRKVPREAFVPAHLVSRAYEDGPLPIGEGQTISQPYIVAAMTEALRLQPGDRVLEIGTGSGYAAAVLSVLAAEVYTIERLERLAASARRRLHDLGYANVHVRPGDGSLGWPEHAPYDAIVVTAGGPDVPPSLLQQLAVGGRLVMPIGPTPRSQRLVRVVRTTEERYDREALEEVAFVPLIGAEGWPAEERWM
jgi:protein-L-isoaspartate(D-aspartate) O-methyltransferase